jgi:hypothetical protein
MKKAGKDGRQEQLSTEGVQVLEGCSMTQAYRRLIRLYPEDIRYAYGDEMVSAFEKGLAERRQRGRVALAVFVFRQLITVCCEAAAERASRLYSHRTFHGRCRPNLGQVRPRT